MCRWSWPWTWPRPCLCGGCGDVWLVTTCLCWYWWFSRSCFGVLFKRDRNLSVSSVHDHLLLSSMVSSRDVWYPPYANVLWPKQSRQSHTSPSTPIGIPPPPKPYSNPHPAWTPLQIHARYPKKNNMVLGPSAHPQPSWRSSARSGSVRITADPSSSRCLWVWERIGRRCSFCGLRTPCRMPPYLTVWGSRSPWCRQFIKGR